jgi:phospholipid/cholesterol/gamma-HCH transport system substrate-binding protein
MEDYRRNITVGLFMALGFACLGVLIILYGELPEFFGANTYTVKIKFDSASGVDRGVSVLMKGPQIGKVDAVDYVDPNHPEQGVFVIAKIEEGYVIPRTASAQIPVPLAFGRPSIHLMIPKGPAAGNLPTDGSAIISGSVVGPMESMIPPQLLDNIKKATQQIGDLAERLTPVAEDLHELFVSRPLQAIDEPAPGQTPPLPNVSTAVARLDGALKNINDVLGTQETKADLRQIITNFRTISEDGKAAVADIKSFAAEARTVSEDAKRITGKVETNLDKLSARLDDMLVSVITDAEKLGKILDDLHQASTDLAEGDGTAGRLLRDPKLYEEITITAQRLSALIGDLHTLVQKWDNEGVKLKGVGLGS